MKKKHALLLLTFQVIFSISHAQAPFQKIISAFGIWSAEASQPTPDKGHVITGGSTMIKIDSSGNIQWTKMYQNAGLHSVRNTHDGGYIACCTASGPSGQDYTVVRTDSIGDTLWTRAYGGALHDWAYAIESTQDTGYIISGSSASFGGAYTIKIDDHGDTLWTKTYQNIDARSIKQTSDGNFIIAGSGPVAGNSSDAFLVKINKYGDTLWTRSYGSSLIETAYDVIQSADGGYALIGSTNSFPNAGQMDLYLLKTDSLGNFSWSKTYGRNYVDEGYALKQTPDGGFILAGRMQGYNGGGGNCGIIGPCYDVYLIRTDNTGDTLWTKMYGGNNLDWAYSVELTDDNGFLAIGQTESFSLGFSSCAYIIKTDSNGNSGCNQYSTNTMVNSHVDITHSGLQVSSGSIIYATSIMLNSIIIVEDSSLCISTGITEISSVTNNFNIYPNPFNDKLNVSTNTNQLSEIILYDITSRKLLQQTFTNSASINTSQLSKGIYIYEVRPFPNASGNKNGVMKKGKVVKE